VAPVDGAPRGRLYLITAVTGALSAISYVLLFLYSDAVMDYSTRGGAWAALPIVGALYVSFAHGAFASNLLKLLGVRAAGKVPKTG
jgi:hypothetical protein